MDFLAVLDDIETQASNARDMFNVQEDGVSASSNRRFLQRKISTVQYNKTLGDAVRFIAEVKSGRRPIWQLKEVMTTDDFPLYFGDILDRTMLAKYRLWPSDWQSYAKRATVTDFRDAKLMLPMHGADGVLEEVQEGAPYPDAALTEQPPILWSVKKRGRRVPFSWEAMINDDLDQLTDIPERLALAARRTENDLVARLFVGASGPNTTLYTSGNGNLITTANGSLNGDHPKLTINGLQSAYNVLSRMTDETGQPIFRDVLTLVVPPALEVQARNIINATEIFDSSILGGGQPDNGSTSGERVLRVANWMRNRLNLVVDPQIPLIASTANGNTSWFLFADPNSSREAIRIGFLRGHEDPEIWMKSPNAVRVGGGPVSAMSGDFDTDSIEYRVRHVTGVTQVDPKATVMSQGTGS